MKDSDISAPAPCSQQDDNTIAPLLFPFRCTTPDSAYDHVLQNNMAARRRRLDMGSFHTTHTDENSRRLFNEFSNILFDSSDPRDTVSVTASRCLSFLGSLFNIGKDEKLSGISSAGTTESVISALADALRRWKRTAAGTSVPNIVVSVRRGGHWDRACNVLGIALRPVPAASGKLLPTAEGFLSMCDEDTVMVVGLCGDEFYGIADEFCELDAALTRFNTNRQYQLPLHVDAGIGGFIFPFLYPDSVFDFRLANVRSINVSSDKFGLVLPGLSWTLWRNNSDALKDDLSLEQHRVAAHVVMQYYQILRLGYEGYRAVADSCMLSAETAIKPIAAIPSLECPSTDILSPYFTFVRNARSGGPWMLKDLAGVLTKWGWVVRTVKVPHSDGAVDGIRLVFRRGMGMDLARRIAEDIEKAVKLLEKKYASLNIPGTARIN